MEGSLTCNQPLTFPAGCLGETGTVSTPATPSLEPVALPGRGRAPSFLAGYHDHACSTRHLTCASPSSTWGRPPALRLRRTESRHRLPGATRAVHGTRDSAHSPPPFRSLT